FARGEAIAEQPQDERTVVDAPAPDESILEIDWTRSTAAILRRIRAAAPYPGAWTFLGDEAIVVTRAEAANAVRGLEPGEAAIVGGVAVVVCADGGVALRAGRRIQDDDREQPVDASAIADLLCSDANE
ncbi:MAG: hypothetical protein ACHREM_26580, partial [Polyangiales bacterium]